MIIAAVFWVLTAVVVALFDFRGWTRPISPGDPTDPADARSADRARAGAGVRQRVVGPVTRARVVRSGVDAVVMLALVRAFFPPPGMGSWLWSAAVVAVGVGVAGVLLGWSRFTPGHRRWPTVAYALVGTGLVVALS